MKSLEVGEKRRKKVELTRIKELNSFDDFVSSRFEFEEHGRRVFEIVIVGVFSLMIEKKVSKIE